MLENSARAVLKQLLETVGYPVYTARLAKGLKVGGDLGFLQRGDWQDREESFLRQMRQLFRLGLDKYETKPLVYAKCSRGAGSMDNAISAQLRKEKGSKAFFSQCAPGSPGRTCILYMRKLESCHMSARLACKDE